jgi:hypothetical protein
MRYMLHDPILQQRFAPNTASSIIRRMLPLKLRTMTILLRLTPVASTTLFLVPRHACPQRDVHSGRRREAEALCDFHEIQLVDVEDAAEAVRRVGLQVGAVAVFGGL